MSSRYRIKYNRNFKRAVKRLSKAGRPDDLKKLRRVVLMLADGQRLAEKYYDHKLTGRLTDYRECHIKPDLLLIYSINEDNRLLILADLGSHSELFD